MVMVNDGDHCPSTWMAPSKGPGTGWDKRKTEAGDSLELERLLSSSSPDSRLSTSGTRTPVLFLVSRLGSVAVRLGLRYS